MKENVYLDYNATARIRPEVISLVTKVMGEVGNASSIHSFGRHARKYVEDARAQVAALVGAKPDQVIFNSGATEGNNTVLANFRNEPVFISAIEHPSIMKAAPQARHFPVTQNGVVDLDALKTLLNDKASPALICIMLVNNKTGTIQPVKEITELAHEKGIKVLCDVAQAAGRIPIDLSYLDVDYMVLSGHKIAGPHGVGALILREGTQIEPLITGGGQERNMRAGTLNVAGIAGLGLAAQLAGENLPAYEKITELRDHLEHEIRQHTNKAIIYGENAPRVGNTSCLGLSGVPAQTQLMNLDLEGFAVSSGSACSSGTWKPSHVLTAMGVSEDEAKSALRISLGWATTSAEIDAFIEAYKKMADNFSK